MDAKPQRPVRAMRIRADENMPPTGNLPQKTIHQRNKSSPALTSLATMAKIGGARTAFGDVSNTVNSNRLGPVKDDLAYPTKVKAHIPEKSTVVPVPQEKKSAPLSKPAQRPYSVSGLKALVTGSSNKEVESLAKSSSATETQGIPTTTANARKLTKRNTTVFKDAVLPTVTENLATTQADSAYVPSTDHFPPPIPLESEAAISVDSEIGQLTSISAIIDKHISHEVNQAASDIPLLNKSSTSADVESKEIGESQTFHDSLRVQPAPELEQPESHALPSVTSVSHNQPAALAANMTATVMEPVSTRYSQSILPETEEYWDDEDNIEEDGYVTAHSYRSRGENTTGGATTLMFPQVTKQVRKELAAAKQLVEASRTAEEIEDECFDTSMVAEYGDEIFAYMKELEIKMLPNAHYMDNQAEIQWSMRSVLIDWVVQVHLRFNLLPETLFLAVNYIDRFLSCKIVSLGKLQLVGATAVFIAAKYEEINCPSVQEIVYMVDNGYTVDEVLKAERFMLSMLQFELGFPGPMSFLRRISKADDYDLETRTLAKYFLEVTIMDERFVGSPASFVAAGSHCLARLMLRKGTWGPSHVYYSGYTYSQLLPLLMLMVECCECPTRHHAAVYNKYCDKRFKRASKYVEAEMASGFQLPVSQKEVASPQMVDFYDAAPWRRQY